MSITSGTKYQRKWLGHFIDENFVLGKGTGTASYARLGKDLEDYAVELNPDVETKKNILGETSVNVKGYEPQGSVEPYYAYEGDPLFTQLKAIINGRETGSELRTTVIDAFLEYGASGITVTSAYKEDAIIIPQSIGGEDGVQIPFEVHYNGNRTAVTGTITDGKFVITTGGGSSGSGVG